MGHMKNGRQNVNNLAVEFAVWLFLPVAID